jgi:serine-type D-Ala-D-Ala carboxypeptidase/endopeptidase (penicillin-binding protein 4)
LRVRRRSQVVAGCIAAAVVAAGGVTVVVIQGDDPAGITQEAPPQPLPRTTPMAALATGSGPTAAGVSSALAGLAADPAFGGSLSALVVDGTDGAVLYARRPNSAGPPASTVKLLTAAAALDALGPDARLSTRVVRSGRTLYLVGGGDMTLASAPPKDVRYPEAPTVGRLARAVAAVLEDGPSYRLRYDDSAWSGPSSAPGWNDGYYYGGDVSRLSALEVDEGRVDPGEQVRVADPAAQAAAVFAAALDRAGVPVKGPATPAEAPTTAEAVAEVSSAPVSALVQRMLTVSDNDLAESLGRAVAVADGEPATFAGAARAITARAEALGATDIRLSDASGLSRLDRVSPAALVAVLQASLERSDLRPLLAGLPVAGLTGTIADRFLRGAPRAGAGVVRAKTGTLTGVSALAGHVVDADGRVLVFAFLTDRAPSTDAAEDALDRLAGRLAGCGCGGAA